jgi:hypothetical protein
MSKSKKEMVEDMRITITAMSEIFEWADIDGALCVPKESENLRVDFLRKGYKWLYNIVYPAFQDAIDIWKLQPREMWERYKRWGEFNEHRESKLLSERLLRLRKIVRAKSRPDFFKRGKINAAIKNLHKKRTRKSSKKTA